MLKVINTAEYISAEFLEDPKGIWAEAWPFEGEIGPVYFRNGTCPYAIAVKMNQETWEEFFSRIDNQWEAFAYIKHLSAAFKGETC